MILIRFIRKGISGGFKTEMSAELIETFDAKTSKYLENTGFSFDM